MASQISKSVDFTKTKNLNISRTKNTFSLFINDFFIAINSFIGMVNFKTPDIES